MQPELAAELMFGPERDTDDPRQLDIAALYLESTAVMEVCDRPPVFRYPLAKFTLRPLGPRRTKEPTPLVRDATLLFGEFFRILFLRHGNWDIEVSAPAGKDDWSWRVMSMYAYQLHLASGLPLRDTK